MRGRRPSSRTVELVPGEMTYLRHQWPLLAALRGALRQEPNVRLAVLIGSAARGTLQERSDVDVLVSLTDAGWRAQDRLRDRLARAVGRPVDLVTLEAAREEPLFLSAVLRDGRVLADRDGHWPRLQATRSETSAAAARAAVELRDELHALVSELSDDG